MYSVSVASLSLSQLPLEHLDQIQIWGVTVWVSLVLWILSRNGEGLSLCVEPVSSLSQCLMLWTDSRHGQAAVVPEPETATRPWHSFSEGSQLHSNEYHKGQLPELSRSLPPFLFSCSSMAYSSHTYLPDSSLLAWHPCMRRYLQPRGRLAGI